MTGKKKRPRDPLDRYYTPGWAIEQCLDIVVPAVTLKPPTCILEPSAGDGAFIKQIRARYANAWIVANDLDPAVGPWPDASESYEGNFLETAWQEVFDTQCRLVIGNPPYILAREFIAEALAIADTVIFILRVDFLCSQGRARFFREHRPSHVFLLPNRPPFYGPGLRPPYTEKPKEHQTGEYDYGWICWSPGGGETKLEWLPEVDGKIRRAGPT